MRSMYSVYDLIHYLKGSIDQDLNLQSILVKGEISNFTNHRSGHWYFSLKDSKAKINCVMFANYACRTPFLLKEGMKVIVSGSVSVFEASGSVQLYATKVNIDGIGELYLQLEQSKQKLAAMGLFEASRKKPLPLYPMKIAIVSGKETAALADVLSTINKRWPIATLDLYPTLVQGLAASKDIIKTLLHVDTLGYDLILLVRGGGSIEDLWCFNDEQLALTIAMMQSVIITGVGHESDTTLVDYVSDARASTPTFAAQMATPNINDVLYNLHQYKRYLIQYIQHELDYTTQELYKIKEHRYFKDPQSYVRDQKMSVEMYNTKLQHCFENMMANKLIFKQNYALLVKASKQQIVLNKQTLTNKKQRLIDAFQVLYKQHINDYTAKVNLLDAYSPLKSLQRGYGIAFKNQQVIKSINDVNINDEVSFKLSDGKLISKIIDIREE